jgi:hypothetical protein
MYTLFTQTWLTQRILLFRETTLQPSSSNTTGTARVSGRDTLTIASYSLLVIVHPTRVRGSAQT